MSFQKLLIQSISNAETRTALQYALLNDTPIERSAIPPTKVDENTLPIGTVEFLRPAIQKDYTWNCYPTELKQFMYRDIKTQRKDEIDKTKHQFIKPVTTKLFTGFVLGENYEEELKFNSLPNDTLVYTSDVVDFHTEYRFYINRKRIIGGDWYIAKDDTPMSYNLSILKSMISLYENNNCYALDVGVFVDGTMCVVEVNDAWAIGLYNKCLNPEIYLNWLWSRWQQIRVE